MYIKIENENQITELARLAEEIWIDHFGPMIPKEMLAYVIEQVQSKAAITKQIQEGYSYYFIEIDGKRVGYFAYKLYQDQNELFLSKLYLLSSERRKGLGKAVIQYLTEVCHTHDVKKLSLTVFHKNLGAIKAYERTGFQNVGLIERDISNGVIIKDYRMEKEV